MFFLRATYDVLARGVVRVILVQLLLQIRLLRGGTNVLFLCATHDVLARGVVRVILVQLLLQVRLLRDGTYMLFVSTSDDVVLRLVLAGGGFCIIRSLLAYRRG